MDKTHNFIVVRLNLDDNVLAQCHWRAAQITAPMKPMMNTISSEISAKIHASSPELMLRRGTTQAAAAAAVAHAKEPARDLPIRVEASEQATVVGVTPSVDAADLVEEGKGGWKRVNYRGVVGWLD